jgi:hydrogenase maturation protein HypF
MTAGAGRRNPPADASARPPASPRRPATCRLAIAVRGIVQGVGFRPFVHRLAADLGLVGWVRNDGDGVRLEIQGPPAATRRFLAALRQDPPPAAVIERLDVREVPGRRADGFRILASAADQPLRPSLPADLAVCGACVREIETPGERRYRYPFTNCTHCGPRYTIVEALPYDRPRTVMTRFALCAECATEYRDPSDRRFHAQPIACPQCGPALTLLDSDGQPRETGPAALERAAEAVTSGQVLALKGLGGFQLLVDATNAAAVARLRERKRREEKPFAVMFPSLDALRAACEVSPADARALVSPEAPILLVRRRGPGPNGGHPRMGRETPRLAEAVAPNNPYVGAMLPSTPLHRLLLSRAQRPLVCTSGNLSEEPMAIDTDEALARLAGVADLFLVHDRPVLRPVDDSVARIGPRGVELLRRARGFAPRPLGLAEAGPAILALGGQLKSTIALARDGQVTVSQHLGDLHSAEGAALLERTVRDLVQFLDVEPETLACDLHPDYASTRLAERLSREWRCPLVRVQHHHAHVAACLAEHGVEGPVLGLAWDGAGYGLDGTVWGGEALRCDGATFQRVAHLRPFPLPGGERAVREPRRAALALLIRLDGLDPAAWAGAWFTDTELKVLRTMIERSVNAPLTTSVGRLFDAVAALTGLCGVSTFEGQAAMALEFAADGVDDHAAYPLPLGPEEPAVADWEPLVRGILDDRRRGLPVGVISARFHNALLAHALEVARRVGLPRVVLSGGCFQNRRLATQLRTRLEAHGFTVYTPRLFPPNDGGLALGQVLVAARERRAHAHVPRHSR